MWETEHGMLFGGRGSQFFWERKTHTPAHNCTVILQHRQGWGQQANTWTRVTLGGSQPKGGTSSQPWQGSDHSPIPTTAPRGEEGRGKVGLEKGWKGVLIFDLVSHHLIPLNLPVNYIIFPQVCFAHDSNCSVNSLSLSQPMSFLILFPLSVKLHHLTWTSSKVTKYRDLFKVFWDFRQWNTGWGTLSRKNYYYYRRFYLFSPYTTTLWDPSPANVAQRTWSFPNLPKWQKNCGY